MNLLGGLRKSREALSGRLGRLFSAGVDDDVLEEAEEVLLESDLGWELTEQVLDSLRKELRRGREPDWRSLLADILSGLIEEHPERNVTCKPEVIMVVGVNGAGKTTTIARLAGLFESSGRKVMMACADTYRAAASRQLELWGERLGIPVFSGREGSDPGAVAFDAVKKAVSGDCDSLLLDTAGRLPTRKGLMDELGKVYRVTGKALPGAPHGVLLVLDGTVGQNALSQASNFMEAVPVTDLAVTKLDGTARGGAVFAMSRELGLPIRYIGIGEGADDIIPFNVRDFVEALVGEEQ